MSFSFPWQTYLGMRIQDLQGEKDQLLVETADMLRVPLFTAEALLRQYGRSLRGTLYIGVGLFYFLGLNSSLWRMLSGNVICGSILPPIRYYEKASL